jgi:hypothetical protein
LNEGDLPGPTAGVIGLVRDTLVCGVDGAFCHAGLGCSVVYRYSRSYGPGSAAGHAQSIKGDEAAAFGYPRER